MADQKQEPATAQSSNSPSQSPEKLEAQSRQQTDHAKIPPHPSSTTRDREEKPPTIGGPKKPLIGNANGLLSGAQDLQARLATLLPQLAAANQDLALPGHDRNMEDVEEGEQHIEMSLGLGVLEERDGSSSSESETSSEESDSDSDDDEDMPNADESQKKRTPRKTDVMDKLMGQSKTEKPKATIEEVG